MDNVMPATPVMVRNRQRSDMEKAALSSKTYEVAEYHYRQGLMTELEYRWFKFFWTWSAVRFAATAGRKHDRAFDRLGTTLYHKRIAKVRRMIARIVYNEQKRWDVQVAEYNAKVANIPA